MQEDTEDFLSTMGDSMARTKPILISLDGMDFTTKESRLVADQLNSLDFRDADERELVIFRWYFEINIWLARKILEANFLEISLPISRDDRLTALACYVAYVSVKLVMEEFYLNMSYRYCGAKRTVKCIHEAVLACFDLLCKNLLMERSRDAFSLRDNIIKAAELGENYLSSQTGELNFQVDDEHHDTLLSLFQRTLRGKYEHGDCFSKLQPSTKAVDDDVGLNGDLIKIKDRLQRSESKLDIIPIVGMGGIGKTTLARKAYMDSEIMPTFHIRAWIVVSQEFRERNVLLGLLESIAPIPNEVYQKDTEQLAEILYRRLKGWRYFIVLDDVWTTETWNKIKLCFPDDKNGSRIILTSRITEVASYVDRENPPHVMNLLANEDGWDLLCKKVYGKDACPRRLISIGKQIAKKCQGLPLAIEVMAGYLSNISETEECWEDVAKRVGFPTDVTQMESLSNILSISYNDLPRHLKACFLTMVNFPKNYEISVRKLIQLWTAMGFLPRKLPNSLEELTMEEVALNCFENLMDRSLIMVKKKKSDGKAKLCGIHDLLWDLSMSKFLEEGHKIFCNRSLFKSDYMNDCNDNMKYVIGINQSLLYYDQSFESDCPTNFEGFKQLRVLDILNQLFDHFPMEITNLFNLRYLALATSGNIPDLICKISNLETLLNYHDGAVQMLPKEIWLLVHLRHLHVGTRTYLSNPPSASPEASCKSLLPNLQSLSYLSCSSCTKEVFLNMPNLKELGIYECDNEDGEDELLCCALENLVNLHQLETLKVCCDLKLERSRCIPDWVSFLPNTIKKLTLYLSNLPWSEMNALAMLPNLEVLNLRMNAFKGEEWEMDDEEFLKLRCLSLDSLDLIFWKANSENFPNLQCLRIRGCGNLCRIPLGFGEVYTLELLDIEFCNYMIYESAIDIQREQMTLGNHKFMFQAGRIHPQHQLMGFSMVFIWLAMQLKTFKPKSGSRKKKLRNRPHLKIGK